ncbi:LytTR family transcriptional regulator DNA-binding domain-containing protein [Paenibacillus sp. FSL L8-0638]|uniref:LytTR family transcriptional regulator DNA-binding domain-containing protein n=1 Tax=Paenibacillus TaxID=44249 RepID=UPI0031592086
MDEIVKELITVTKEVNGDIVSIPIRDILFGIYDGLVDRIIVHTRTEFYYLHSTLVFWTTTLRNSGYNFFKADRYHMINVDNITILDERKRCVYFDEEPSKKSKRCLLAYHKFTEVRQELLFLNPSILIT